MQAFEHYVRQLQGVVQKWRALQPDEVHSALDGAPSAALRRLVPLSERRESGAFFTDEALARRLVALMSNTIDSKAVIFDPACGAGDLLLAAARHLRVAPTVERTIAGWSKQLLGQDIHSSFIQAAAIRLALAAVRRGASLTEGSGLTFESQPNLRTGSCLDSPQLFRSATHVLLNPPFTMVSAPAGCEWAQGRTNSAAIFLETTVKYLRPGAYVAAILPEVLRSGSRYARWRGTIASHLEIARIEIVGQFAPDVDIDVFLLFGQAKKTASQKLTSEAWHAAVPAVQTLDSLYEVSVGTLVPYRDPHQGPWRPVIVPKGLPAWGIVHDGNARRKFEGRAENGPFVVVRRTSRPGDPARAIATIVAMDEPAVVENHLMVLRPRAGGFAACKRLVKALRRPETSNWLDQRIRCRHLTVGSLRELPLWEY